LASDPPTPARSERAAALQARFGLAFGGAAPVFRAPGRVNLIGEHTDYNDGFVMPVGLELACRVAARLRDDGRLVVESVNFGEHVEIELTQPLEPRGHWSDYVAGVTKLLLERGCPIPGADLLVESDVPVGAGLSSSAALEVSVATALLGLTGFSMDPASVARLCQQAEHEFVGAAVGIMDQFIACYARRGTALALDCRSLDHRYVPLPTHVRLVASNTMIEHAISAGEYNRRRQQCDEAVRVLREEHPQISSLRDITLRDLDACRDRLGELLFRRARHVVSENERVQAAAAALERVDLDALGSLMAASHRSLRDDYEVSCPELDAMVEIAQDIPGVFGTRMTGGGFGGCTITLIDETEVERLLQRLPLEYAARTGRRPDVYVTDSADGAGVELAAEW
jgi:galactokinase